MADDNKGHGHTISIVVNGIQEKWGEHDISYEQVIKLAFPTGPFGGDVRYSVSWTKPGGHEGSLRRGQSVDVVDHMNFDVRNTDKS
ncbi:MAG TPA: multiubiquitin domain-containing protein [Candidatus Paceibacterota bacterium]|nr:multiubiquitin domain-containing protein [Candidatus Paceibacterota bacterium]